MTVRPRLFFDASVFVAASGSPTGGSALVLELCRQSHATAVSSQLGKEFSLFLFRHFGGTVP